MSSLPATRRLRRSNGALVVGAAPEQPVEESHETVRRRPRPPTGRVDQGAGLGVIDERPARSTAQIVAGATAGRPGILPFAERIQAAFGAHDLSGVRAYTGDAATAGSRELGARAFTTGDSVVFGRTPDLYTAAHEAAHVVQQRAGITAPGVGARGDRFERQADQVAAAVEQGRSAAPMLGEPAGRSSGAGPSSVVSVQLVDEEAARVIIQELQDELGIVSMTNDERWAIIWALDTIKKPTEAKSKAKEMMQTLKAKQQAAAAQAAQAAPVQVQTQTNAGTRPLPPSAKKTLQPSAAATQQNSGPSAGSTKKYGAAKSIGQFHAETKGMAPKLGFAKVATDAKDLATPVVTTQQPVDNRSAALKAARDAWWTWDVHEHDGMNGHNMSVDDLVALGKEAENDTRFFVRVGLGTGKFGVGQQLKIIHKSMTDAKTGKKCTFHVSAGDQTLAAVAQQGKFTTSDDY